VIVRANTHKKAPRNLFYVLGTKEYNALLIHAA